MNYILIIIVLLSLIALGYNILFLNSVVLGVIVAPVFLFIVSLFCGNAFFPQESQRFRIFYGFIVLFCLLVILGSIAYWVRDLSNLPILVILSLITIFLVLLNLRGQPTLPLAGNRPKEWIARLNLGVLDLFFLSMIGLGYYFLFAARTGESIPPPWTLVSGGFFLCLILATATLVIKIWHGKSPSGLLLFYTILLVLIPAFGLLILMHQPYLTMKGAISVEWDRAVTEFGRFVSDPSHPEAIKSVMDKSIIEIGQNIGNTFVIKLFQFPPAKFGLFFVPILFTPMVVLTAFDLIRSLAPSRKELALLCSLSFLAIQHNIFLFTPPGKNETFALGLFMVSMMLWIKLLPGEKFKWVSFIALVILLGAILLIHQYVGLFALFLAVSALILFLVKPFQGGLPRLWLWLGLTIGFMVVWVYGYPYLHSLASYLVGGPVGGTVGVDKLTISRFIDTIAPPLWLGEGLGIFQGIFYGFINNSVYFTYALIILAVIAAFRYRLNKNWLAVILAPIILAFVYFGVVGNFHEISESYRFFYYFNFLAFPLIGIGLFWAVSYIAESVVWLYTKSGDKERAISLKPVQLVICGLVFACLFTSSVYAGYPRPDSMGPYRQQGWQISYPSDYDVAALSFVEETEGDNGDFFIVGDTPTCAAGMATLGYQVISTMEGYVPIFSFFSSSWSSDELFNHAVWEPIKYLVEGTDYTGSLADTTYLIFTYRLGMDKLKSTVDFYSKYLDSPVYTVEDKVYVFNYDREKITNLMNEQEEAKLILYDDEQVEDRFWQLQFIGKGDIGFSISDNTEIKKQGNRCLQVTISPGEHERATLQHVWYERVDLSKAKYLLVFAYGANTGEKYHIVFRDTTSSSYADYFVYVVRDNFEGWNLLAIPLKSFNSNGSASWYTISEMLIQFYGSWPPRVIYFDEISVVEELPLKSLAEESLIILP